MLSPLIGIEPCHIGHYDIWVDDFRKQSQQYFCFFYHTLLLHSELEPLVLTMRVSNLLKGLNLFLAKREIDQYLHQNLRRK